MYVHVLCYTCLVGRLAYGYWFSSLGGMSYGCLIVDTCQMRT